MVLPTYPPVYLFTYLPTYLDGNKGVYPTKQSNNHRGGHLPPPHHHHHHHQQHHQQQQQQPPILRIMDARPVINAVGNAFMGKGSEVISRLGGG